MELLLGDPQLAKSVMAEANFRARIFQGLQQEATTRGHSGLGKIGSMIPTSGGCRKTRIDEVLPPLTPWTACMQKMQEQFSAPARDDCGLAK